MYIHLLQFTSCTGIKSIKISTKIKSRNIQCSTFKKYHKKYHYYYLHKTSSSRWDIVVNADIPRLIIKLNCLSYRILRSNVFKRQNESQKNTTNKSNSDFVSTPGIYDTAVDNDRYQELGQLSGSSHYDQLKGASTNLYTSK